MPIEKLPLSIIILSHRQNSVFEHCLASAQLAKEVIIVDNSSQNDWSQLSQSYSFSVLTHPKPITDFSKVRNVAMSKARHDWVLFLDSDEVISRTSYQAIKQCLQSTDIDGFFLLRNDVFLGKKLYWGEAAQLLLRLVKKNRTQFERPVHEIAVVDGKISDSEISLKHYSHASISQFIIDIARYSTQEGSYRFTQLKQRFSWLMLFVFPPLKFFETFFVRFGFLDGWRGFIYSITMCIHSVGVRVAQYELSHKK